MPAPGTQRRSDGSGSNLSLLSQFGRNPSAGVKIGPEGTVFKTLAVGFSIFFLIAFGKCVRVSSGHMEAVSVSPDGKLLSGVYGYQDEHGVFIYKIAVETGVATRLTEAKSGWESSPTFSADGKQIAFSYESGNGEQPGS